MKLILLLLSMLIVNMAKSIDSYRIGDTLSVAGNNLNIRSSPSLNSNILLEINFGEKVVALQQKFDKSSDKSIGSNDDSLNSFLTGHWLKIKYSDVEGYVFDLYLSKLNFKEISNLNKYLALDTIRNYGYNTYYRYTKSNAVLIEIGTAIEWANESYLIPDISFEEAIAFIKPRFKYFSNRVWNLDNSESEILMTDNDLERITFRDFAIRRIGNYMWINIGESM